MSVLLELRHISQRYAAQEIVKSLSLQLEQGEIGCLLGHSGCGKTTVLRCIAGFEPIHDGEILLEQQPISRPNQSVPPHQRQIGMVFQDYALFPHLSVADNIGFGLHQHTASHRQQRITELLELVGLTAHAQAYPHELSGGQQQRVALARALAPKPQLLLLDEPFSNLDVALRERLGQEVRDILKREQMTAILVTHDQHEAFAIADQIGVMQAGQIVQWATPYELYHQPANRFVADFVGKGVFVPGTITGSHCVEIEFGEICRVDLDSRGFAVGSRVDVLLRPDDVVHDDFSPLKAQVVNRAFQGEVFLYTLALASGQQVLATVASHHNHRIGEWIGIKLDLDHLIAFPS